MSIKNTRFISFGISIIMFSGILIYSFVPDLEYGRNVAPIIFAIYLASLVPVVFFWKRLKGWADGYIGGFSIGAVVWVSYFIIRGLI